MLLLFAAAFAVAVNFSILFFLTFPNDRTDNVKSVNKTLRPFYLITIAIIFWAMTYPLLLAPDQIVTIVPTQTLTANSIQNGNTLYTFAAINVITNNNYPLATQSFYGYLPIWIAVMGLHGVILLMYILEFMSNTIEDDIGERG